MSEYEYQVGDRVKLVAYAPHSDYEEHDNQEATVVGIDSGDDELPCAIRWSDGVTSHVRFANLILVDSKQATLLAVELGAWGIREEL